MGALLEHTQHTYVVYLKENMVKKGKSGSKHTKIAEESLWDSMTWKSGSKAFIKKS